MTLGEFFQMLGNNPSGVCFFFIAVPVTAALALIYGKGEANEKPWNYLYSLLVHLAVIPGLFAITLNIYLFMFERLPIMETNLFTQVLPTFSMIATLVLVRKNTCFEDILGFGRLSALIVLVLAILSLMWLMDRTHIIAITFIPFHWVIVFFLVILVIFRFAGKRLFS